MRKLMVLALSAALPLAWACGRAERVASEQLDESDVAPVASEQEKAGTGQPGDLNPIEAESFIDDVTLGSEVGSDGAILAGKTGDDFTSGQTVHLAMEVGDTPAGSAVKVVWYGPGEARLGEDSQSVTAGTRYLTFSARDTSSWAIGDYRAEVWIGDEKVASEQFNIVAPGDQAL